MNPKNTASDQHVFDAHDWDVAGGPTPAAVSPRAAAGPPSLLNASDPIWVWYADAWLRGHVHHRGPSDGLICHWPGVAAHDALHIKISPGQGFPTLASWDWDLLIPDASSPEVRPRTGTHTPRQLKAVYG